MRDEYDFSDAKRHPLAGQFKGKYTVTVHYDFTGPDSLDEEYQSDLEQPMTDGNTTNPPTTVTG